MRTSYLIHGFWLLIAIGAFAIGKMQQGSPDPTTGSTERSARDSSRPPSSSKSTRDGAAARTPGGKSSPLGTGRALTAEAMKLELTKVLAETDPIIRQRRFAELLESLTPENARAAVQALQDAPRSRWSWGQEYSLLTYAWGRLDGPAAVAYARDLEGRTREWTMGSVLAGWANAEPDAAKQWVSGIEDADERSRFTRGLVYGLAQKNVEAATSFVYSLNPESSRRGEYIGSIARQQLSQGIDAAATWSATLPDGDLKGEALETVAREYVRSDPAQAAAWATQWAESDYGSSAIAEISEEWAEDDPKAALDWVTTLPEGDNRNRALSETISEWADDDAVAAGNYLTGLAAGNERDAAVGAYARRIADEEPESAIEWAQSIGGEELRNETITRAAREWLRNDVAAASEWLESAQLAEPVVEDILQPRENDRGRDWRRR